MGAWDAHNVTEDAELGLRLARAGYRTEIVPTTTFEEANAALVPWIRQRSRWLKGYLVTWAVAMRSPRALLRDLGLWRFLGLQVQMICGVMGFLLAPLLWSFAVKVWDLPHPLDPVVSGWGYGALGAMMLFGLLVSVCQSCLACRAEHLRHLRWRAPLAELYYVLGTVAAWVAALELVIRPYFWAKTNHGDFGALHPSQPEDVEPSPGSHPL